MTTRLGKKTLASAALAGLLICLGAAEAVAGPPWKHGRHGGHPGWHGHHRHYRPPPVVVIPPPVYRPPPVIVLPGYAVPYAYGYGPYWGYGGRRGEAELRLRLPIR